MKKHSAALSIPVMIFILIITFTFVDAQSQSSSKLISYKELQSAAPPSLELMISIPDEYASKIVRENGDNAVYFKFKKSDGTTAFLFQVNKIPENQWMGIKSQLTNPIILDHKNGFIYYSLVTDKSHIKGADSAAYEQVYNRLHQLISSVTITDGDNK